jgi:hypothetical protein
VLKEETDIYFLVRLNDFFFHQLMLDCLFFPFGFATLSGIFIFSSPGLRIS